MQSRRHRPRTEEEWLDQREQAARRALNASVAGLAEDLGAALQLPPRIRSHPLLRETVDRAGDILASDAVLNAIETTVSLRTSGLLSGASVVRAVSALSRRART